MKKYEQLDKALAIVWVKKYRSIKLPDLNSTVPTGADTKSIFYTRELLEDMVAEIKCQGATGIKAFFCTMREKDPFAHQLMLDFLLTLRIGNEEVDFNVQDRDGWLDRKAAGDLDTGSPCPPNFCGGELIPPQ